MNSLDGAIKAKAKLSVGEKFSESKPNEEAANEESAQPDWQKKGWTNETKLAGKRGFLLKKGKLVTFKREREKRKERERERSARMDATAY